MGREDLSGFYLSGAETGFFKRGRNICQKKEAAPFAAGAGSLFP